MPKAYKKVEIPASRDDIKVIYQGVSYIAANESTKVSVGLLIDEFEEPVDNLLYLIEIEDVDVELFIEDQDFKLHLKQYFHYYKSKWKLNKKGISDPEEKMPNLVLGIVINIDEKIIDVEFDKWS